MDAWEGSCPSFPMHLWISQDSAQLCSTPQYPTASQHPAAPCSALPSTQLQSCVAAQLRVPALAQPTQPAVGLHSALSSRNALAGPHRYKCMEEPKPGGHYIAQ